MDSTSNKQLCIAAYIQVYSDSCSTAGTERRRNGKKPNGRLLKKKEVVKQNELLLLPNKKNTSECRHT